MNAKQLKRAALNLKREREDALLAIDFPTRKTGEMSCLHRTAVSTSATLEIYDKQETPPPRADLFRQTFEECIVHLEVLCAPKTDDAKTDD